MPAIGDEKVYLYVRTPLDGAFRKFSLEDIEGDEHISGLFHYRLRLTSDDAEPVDFKKILGQPITVTIELHGGSMRYINGLVTQFIQADTFNNLTTFYADIRPWLWECTLTTDCRIFQNQNVLEIIKTIFDELGFTDVKIATKRTYKPRVYCVQYNETAFNFVSRLMEEEGIFYFFEHTEEIHALVLADDTDAHQVCIEKAKFLYVEPDHETEDTISNCTIEEQLVPNKYASRDYNFETPNTRLMSSVDAKHTGKFRVYTYPGIYGKTDDGDKISDSRIESYELPSKILRGQGFCRAFTAGYKFNLTEHKRPDFNIAYVLSGVFIHATPERYFNHFEAFPADVPYRPLRITPKPRIYSSQTAVVVGKAGEEIWTDKYGRVKVQFHWDELGKKDENSSCWVRVAQIGAGKSFGMICIPRIGTEVVVSFLEGDPDNPLIIGTVFNSYQTVPYSLPENKTRMTLKGDSTPGGGGYNELRYEDKKGEEEIYLQAEKDWNILVKNDKAQTIKHDETLTVKNDRTKKVEGNQSETVVKDKTIEVDGNHTETVVKDKTLEVQGNHTEIIVGDKTLQVDGNHTETIVKDKMLEVQGNHTETIAKNMSLQVRGDTKTTVSGSRTESVGGGKNIDVGASHNENIGGNMQISIGQNKTETVAIASAENVGAAKALNVAAGYAINVGGAMNTAVLFSHTEEIGYIRTVKAGNEIILSCGKANITLKKDGTIELQGVLINVEGSEKVTIKGKPIHLNP